MLKMDFLLCKADEKKFNDFFHSKFVRGYLVGFFDSVVQSAGLHINSDGHFIALMSIGHSYLLDGDLKKAGFYVVDSLSLQGDKEFDNAQMQGGETYFNFMNGSIRVPNGLSRRFHNIQPTDA